jgi:hypothetical protein
MFLTEAETGALLAAPDRSTSTKAVQLGMSVGGPGGSPVRMSIATVAL